MTTLTPTDRRALACHEQVIARGLQTFREVGEALAQIRDNNLYAEYGSFESYCRRRWEFSIRRAEQQINAAHVVAHLEANKCSPLPANEAQVRPLTMLRNNEGVIDLQLVDEVWRHAVRDENPTPTAAHVEETIRQWKEARTPEEPEPVEDEPAEPDSTVTDTGPGGDTYTPEPCPNCGGTDFDPDGDCVKCLEPVHGGSKPETEESNAAFDALVEFVGEWIAEHEIQSAVAAAMLENLATRMREGPDA